MYNQTGTKLAYKVCQ